MAKKKKMTLAGQDTSKRAPRRKMAKRFPTALKHQKKRKPEVQPVDLGCC